MTNAKSDFEKALEAQLGTNPKHQQYREGFRDGARWGYERGKAERFKGQPCVDGRDCETVDCVICGALIHLDELEEIPICEECASAPAALESYEKELAEAREEAITQAQLLVHRTESLNKARAENERLKETLSYLPKVPTEPYERTLAKEIVELRAEVERLTTLYRNNFQWRINLGNENNRLRISVDSANAMAAKLAMMLKGLRNVLEATDKWPHRVVEIDEQLKEYQAYCAGGSDGKV